MYSMLSFVVLIMCLFFSSTPAIIAVNPQQSDRITITGVIKDAHGELMIGATVKVKGQSIGSVTGVDGKYELRDVPKNGILEFSYVGMESKDVPVAGKTVINVSLNESSVLLNRLLLLVMEVLRRVM